MKLDPNLFNVLRETTHKAIEDEAVILKRIEEEKAARLLEYQAIAKAWVEATLRDIPKIAKTAAQKKQWKVKVADTRGCFYAVKRTSQKFDGWDITNIDGIKFSLLQTALDRSSFHTYVTYQHDGVGMEDWFELWISWDYFDS